jgi:hypothetical protein
MPLVHQTDTLYNSGVLYVLVYCDNLYDTSKQDGL